MCRGDPFRASFCRFDSILRSNIFFFRCVNVQCIDVAEDDSSIVNWKLWRLLDGMRNQFIPDIHRRSRTRTGGIPKAKDKNKNKNQKSGGRGRRGRGGGNHDDEGGGGRRGRGGNKNL